MSDSSEATPNKGAPGSDDPQGNSPTSETFAMGSLPSPSPEGHPTPEANSVETSPKSDPDKLPDDVSADEAYEAVYGYKPSESPEEMAKAMLQDALIGSVQSIVTTALNAPNDRLRFEAAKYITEWNLGKPGDKGAPTDLWEQLQKELTQGT